MSAQREPRRRTWARCSWRDRIWDRKGRARRLMMVGSMGKFKGIVAVNELYGRQGV